MGSGKDKWYFDHEFKYEAIRLMNEGKRSLSNIAKDLDVPPNVLHQWRPKYWADMEHAFVGKGHMRSPGRKFFYERGTEIFFRPAPGMTY